MHFFIGIIFLLISAVMAKSSVIVAVVIALLGVFSFIKSRKDKTVFVVNNEGFYYYDNLITNWNNFVSARFLDEVPALAKDSAGISDKFFISLRYYKDDQKGCFERKFALTNTQDKSEEEILAAIRFYYQNWKVNQSK